MWLCRLRSADGNSRGWKNSESSASCGVNLFWSFSFIFYLQKLHWMLRAFVSYWHWPWRNGVNKTPPFLHFLIDKGGTRTISHLPIAEGLSFRSLDRRIYDCKLRNENKGLFQVRSEFSPGCESRRQKNSTCSRPRFREIWKVSSLSRSLLLSWKKVSPRPSPRSSFPRPPTPRTSPRSLFAARDSPPWNKEQQVGRAVGKDSSSRAFKEAAE